MTGMASAIVDPVSLVPQPVAGEVVALSGRFVVVVLR
jgi:hypothetical protein